jgi:DNA-binding GntR family transcriptional regulator
MREIITIDEVYYDLRNKIENLELKPAAKISENELSREYNVSRHIIRGAFNRLKEQKLIEVYPQRGTYVSLIDMKLISDYIFIRESIEMRNLYDVMKYEFREELCDRLSKNIEEQKVIANEFGYCDEYQKADMNFHKMLLEVSGRQDVLNLIENQGIYLRRWKNLELNYTKRIPQIIVQHTELIEAIKKQDLQKGRDILHEHLACVYRVSETLLDVDYKKYLKIT